MSLHVFSAPSISRKPNPTGSPLVRLEPDLVVAPPSKLQLSGSSEGVLIELVLEEVCLCCGGAGFVPVTVTETLSLIHI